MPKAVIEIRDEVNVKFRGLPKNLLQQASNALSWYTPGYRFNPSVVAGRWNGKISLFSDTGHTYFNLLEECLPIFEAAGYDFEIEDHRKDYSHITDNIVLPDENLFSEYCWKDGSPIILRDYQVSAVRTAIRHGSGLLEMATGSGKSLSCAAITKVYSDFGKVIVIVPNIDLAIQTQSTFKRVGLDCGIWYGEMKDSRNVTISTWQSLDNYPELMIDVVAVILDEAHQAKAKTIGEIMSTMACNVPFRFGCTGTIPKETLAKNQVFAAIGEPIFRLKAWELQKKGVLAKSHTYQIVMEDSKHPNYQHAQFEDWAGQLDWMFANQDRLATIADMIIETSKVEGNTLVLVHYQKHAEILQELIPNSVAMDGRVKSKKRQAVYEWFGSNTGNVLICTFGIASTGLDIPEIQALYMIEPGKKFEKVIQSIGRVLRKATGKDSAIIADICGDTDYSNVHARSRRKMYKDEKYPFSVEKLDYVNS